MKSSYKETVYFYLLVAFVVAVMLLADDKIYALTFAMLCCGQIAYLALKEFISENAPNKQYICEVRVEILGLPDDEDFRVAEEVLKLPDISLPFVPFKGLELSGFFDEEVADVSGDYYSGVIERIQWNGAKFICWAEPFKLKDGQDITKVLAYNEERGWQTL